MLTVQTSNLTKIYRTNMRRREVLALNELNLSVESGSVFGLLGPNGAGKTTLIKILLGITSATSGTASILNEDISNYKIKNKIGYLPENHRYPGFLTGGEALRFFTLLGGADKINVDKKVDELLELVNLLKWKKTKIKNYSKGMMQRLGLAQAISNNPDLIFLDEPTDGVDPIGRKEIRDLLLQLKNQGKTIFLNSHLLSEVELISDRVAILNKGVLLREGTVEELTEKKQEFKISVQKEDTTDLSELFAVFPSAAADGSVITLKVSSPEELNRAIDLLRARQILIKSLIPQRESLEEMFIALIKESEGGKK